jgi:hypothetical protein
MAIDKKNIFLSDTVKPYVYRAKSKFGSGPRIPQRIPTQHAATLKQDILSAYKKHNDLTPKQVAAIKYKDGICLEFSGQKAHELMFRSLENMSSGIRLRNVKVDTENDVVHATVFIPKGKESFFIKRIDKYAETANVGKPRHQDFINSIEEIKLAVVESFWIGKTEDMPKEIPVWCEVWIQTDNDEETIENIFSDICKELQISISVKSIKFPERTIRLIRANGKQLAEIIRQFAYVAEFRRMEEPVSFFDELKGNEQKEWIDELLKHTEFKLTDTSVCILDTGVNAGHPLLRQAIEDDCVQTVNPSWTAGDHEGHGTEVAGVSLFNDLRQCLLSSNQNIINHYIESVKILPPKGENEPELYGAITQNAVFLAETVQPKHKRAICMTVTSSEHNTGDGKPTSWSGAVDSLIAGVGDGQKRLLFVSAGNVFPEEVKKTGYIDANVNHSVESPGQAWNAITVGAFSKDILIKDKRMKDYHPIADVNELSPYSSTSLTWKNEWPIKPEILCDGGNMATDGINFMEAADLSLLTTHHQPANRLFSTIHGTSASTAQAAWMAARIMAEYPDIWPETVRALLIHSARWSDKMKKQFLKRENKTACRELLRSCGYGIPDLDTAIQCINNSVNLVVQEEIQPYHQGGAMNIHTIPWPSDVLQELGEIMVTMRITLSYFIEPGPGEIGWQNKYRYPSCGLRFDVINKNETEDDFKKRIDVAMRGENKKDKGEGTSGSEFWFLGSNNRDVGSIHSDFRTQYAVELCTANKIAIYPVIGWWRERKNLGCQNNKIRYSLIVSISTLEKEVDFYTPIVNQIKPVVSIEIKLDK